MEVLYAWQIAYSAIAVFRQMTQDGVNPAVQVSNSSGRFGRSSAWSCVRGDSDHTCGWGVPRADRDLQITGLPS
jgi:hypothetical protein